MKLHYWKLLGDPSTPNELPNKAVTPDIAMNEGAPGGAFGLDGMKVDCGPKGAISGFKFKKQGALNTYQYQCVNPVVGKGPNYAGANFGSGLIYIHTYVYIYYVVCVCVCVSVCVYREGGGVGKRARRDEGIYMKELKL